MEEELLFRAATGRANAGELDEVHAWRAASVRNEQRYREISELLLLVAEADSAPDFGAPPPGEALLDAKRARDAAALRRARLRAALLSVAAALALVVMGMPHVQRASLPVIGGNAERGLGPHEFVTERDPATVGLRDGTVVRLGPETRLRLEAVGSERVVSLTGRGYFAVSHDPHEPFTIRTDAGMITVLGTRFDVSVAGDDLRLVVVEGSVRLQARGRDVVVRAGQLAQVVKGNIVPPVDVPNPAALLGWVGNFVAFQNTPLGTVAREIEELHGVRMLFSEPALEARGVTAIFAGRTFDEIAEVVCIIAHLHCERRGDVLHVSPAH